MPLAEQQARVFELPDYMKDDLDTEAGASALIGPEGGVVTVTDPASPILGTSLRVPVGALDEQTVITIREGNHCCDFGLGPSIKLLPDGLHFKRAATLTIYLDDSEMKIDGLDRNFPEFYQYDECRDRWTRNHAAGLKKLGNAVVCELHHL